MFWIIGIIIGRISLWRTMREREGLCHYIGNLHEREVVVDKEKFLSGSHVSKKGERVLDLWEG